MKPIRAAEILVEKIRRDYKDDISIVVIMGSTIYNDTHSRSDLDMYFVSKTNRGKNLAFVCIIDGIGYDFWDITWERLERIANHDEKITSIITEGMLLYYGDESDFDRFNELKRRALDTGNKGKFIGKAREIFSEVYRDYSLMLTAPTLSKARYAAVGVVYALTHALALLNRITVKRGRGKLKGEILAMPLVPDNFEALYDTVFLSFDVGEMREACGKLIKNTSKLIRKESEEPRPFTEALTDFYEELINLYNKIYHAVEIADPYTALFAGVEINRELDWAFAGTGVAPEALPDLLEAYSPDNLIGYAEAAREQQLQFEQLLTTHGVALRRFGNFDELEEYMRGL